MKKNKRMGKVIFTLTFIGICSLFMPNVVKATPANSAFKDDAFYSCILSAAGLEVGANITDEQLLEITSLTCYGSTITDTSGLEKLTNLEKLEISSSGFNKIDLSKNTELKTLILYNNVINSIDISKNSKLHSLTLSMSKLTSLDVKTLSNLATLDVYSTEITELDLSNNTSLISLNLTAPKISSIDLSKNLKLQTLSISSPIGTLDLANNKELGLLTLSSNMISTLDLSKNTKLTDLNVGSDKISILDLSNNVLLTSLIIECANLKSLDLGKNTKLTGISITDDSLETIDLSNTTSLTYLHLNGSDINCIDVSKTILKSFTLPYGLTKVNLGNISVNTLYRATPGVNQDPVGSPITTTIDVSPSLFTSTNNITTDNLTIYRDASNNNICGIKVESDVNASDKENVKDESNSNNKEEVKDESNSNDKDEIKDESNSDKNTTTDKEITNSTPSDKQNVETTVENPATGVYSVLGILSVLVTVVAFILFKKKNYFAKI